MAKGKKGSVKAPISDPASLALKESKEESIKDREEKAVEAEIINEEAVKEMKASFDIEKVIKDANIPDHINEIWVTEDTQVFFNEGFAKSHGSRMKLKVTHVKI